MKFIVIDCETTGTDWKTDKLHGLGVAYEEDDTEYYLAEDIMGNQRLLELLADPSVAKVGHNIKFDIKFLLAYGLTVAGPLYDTMEMAQLVDENTSVGLKQLAEKYLGVSSVEEKREVDRACSKAGVKHIGELCQRDITGEAAGTYTDLISRYCQEDCNNTTRLFFVLSGLLKKLDIGWRKLGAGKTPFDYYKEEMSPLNEVILTMETTGIALDMGRVEVAKKALAEDIKDALKDLEAITAPYIGAIEDSLYHTAVSKRKSTAGKNKVERSSEKYATKFNWSSNDHLASLIYEQLRVPKKLWTFTKSGKPSVSDKDLGHLRRLFDNRAPKLCGVLDALSKYKKAVKLLTTYLGDEDTGVLSHVHKGRIFASYHQAASSKDGGKGGTLTGRLSSQSPNMQNLPRGGFIKRLFIPDEGSVFLYFDYSQLELRLAAHLSGDPELVEAFRRGLDLHTLTAATIFNTSVDKVTKEQRQVAKTINFAMIYDASAYRLAEELNKGGANYTIEEVEAMRKAFFRRYKVYREYLYTQRDLLENRKALISAYGRVRRLPEIAYKEGLNWAHRTWTGPVAMRDALKHTPTEKLSDQDIFTRAKRKQQHALKQAYNFPIQSLGASITKRAMLALHKEGFKIASQVHDSIIIQVPEKWATQALKKALQIAENVIELDVPLKAEGKILKSLDESDIWQPDSQNSTSQDTRSLG